MSDIELFAVQLEPSATAQERLGKELPDAPGVWFRDGQIWLCSRYWDIVNQVLQMHLIAAHDGHLVTGSRVQVGFNAPRGNWFPASPPLSTKERERLDAIIDELQEKSRQQTLQYRADWIALRTERDALESSLTAAREEAEEVAAHALAVIYCEPLPNGDYVHALTCSGNRKVPPGTPGHCCSCRIASRQLLREAIKRAEAAEEERAKLREALSHAAFSLWGQGDHKVAAAEADFKRSMDELGIDWNGEKVAAPQGEK